MSGGGVGRSWRTVAKHALMRSFIGQEVGAVNMLARRGSIGGAAWFDQTAGDGVAPDDMSWKTGCSPYNTGGFVPVAMVRRFDRKERCATKLVEADLWDWTSRDNNYGYQFHEWSSSQRPDYRRNIPDSVRFAVYERDGYCCVKCGKPSPLSLDHIWPWSLGGTDERDNLQTLCIPCNCSKGACV